VKKALTALIVITGVYGLPLAARPELLADWKLLTVIAGAAIIFLSQPGFSLKEARDRQSTDRASMIFILAAGMVSQIIPVVDWAYFGRNATGLWGLIVTALGLMLLVLGLAFRIWSIRHLGEYFTATVQIVDRHELVTSGPYAFVRHPSYLGAYVAIVGAAVFLNSLVGAAVAAAVMAAAYHLRIRAEEEILVAEFGRAYETYRRRVPTVVPRLSPIALGAVGGLAVGVVIAAALLSQDPISATPLEDWPGTISSLVR
jgi:protein-S-isoprenylcysteine O-methyltransferase Ste14